MRKKSWRRALEACAFLLLLGAVLAGVSGLLERKSSRNLYGGFFEAPQDYDVLFLGNSQFMNAVSPMDMWADYGIAGYNLSSYGASIPVAYWTMVNALDAAQPDLVVLAVYGMHIPYKVPDYSAYLHMALDCFPLTVNKVRAMDDLLDDPEAPNLRDKEGNLYREMKEEFLFPLVKYHSRWSKLTAEDFAQRPAYVKGGELMVGVQSIWDYALVDQEDYGEESGYAYEYLRRMIEECQRRQIDILLVHLPNPNFINSQRHANTVRSIAGEYGVDFVDFTYLDSIVDYAVDCYDLDPHLNVSGTLKMTDFLGSYIRERYQLPDHRGKAAYAHWNDQLDAHQDEKRRMLAGEEKLNNALMLLHDPDYDVTLALFPPSPVYGDDQAIVLMHNLAREHVLAGEEYDKASSVMFPLPGFDEALANEQPYYLNREGKAVTEYTGDRAEQAALETFGERGESTLLIRAVDRRSGIAVQLRY